MRRRKSKSKNCYILENTNFTHLPTKNPPSQISTDSHLLKPSLKPPKSNSIDRSENAMLEKKARFTEESSTIINTYSKKDYCRSDFLMVPPSNDTLIELNYYKMNEMAVHELSRSNTQFHRIQALEIHPENY
eukprot:Awhi_evm1s1650